jgi:hypothetical protein
MASQPASQMLHEWQSQPASRMLHEWRSRSDDLIKHKFFLFDIAGHIVRLVAVRRAISAFYNHQKHKVTHFHKGGKTDDRN